MIHNFFDDNLFQNGMIFKCLHDLSEQNYDADSHLSPPLSLSRLYLLNHTLFLCDLYTIYIKKEQNKE